MARLAAVAERRASFREERWFAALNTPLRSAGRLAFRSPARLEMLTDWPEAQSLIVDGDRLIVSRGLGPARTLDLAAQPAELRILIEALRAPLAGDLATLRRAFTLAVDGTHAAWTLRLAPRDPALAALLEGVRIAGRGAEPRELETRLHGGDVQRLWIEPAP